MDGAGSLFSISHLSQTLSALHWPIFGFQTPSSSSSSSSPTLPLTPSAHYAPVEGIIEFISRHLDTKSHSRSSRTSLHLVARFNRSFESLNLMAQSRPDDSSDRVQHSIKLNFMLACQKLP